MPLRLSKFVACFNSSFFKNCWAIFHFMNVTQFVAEHLGCFQFLAILKSHKHLCTRLVSVWVFFVFVFFKWKANQISPYFRLRHGVKQQKWNRCLNSNFPQLHGPFLGPMISLPVLQIFFHLLWKSTFLGNTPKAQVHGSLLPPG